MSATITWSSTGPDGGWAGAGSVRLLDQRLLPTQEIVLDVREPDELVTAIQGLAVRGAPALGVAGALGVALAVQAAEQSQWSQAQRDQAIARIRDARPTAVNLAWAVDRMVPVVNQGLDAVLAAAHELATADEAANRAMARVGVDWLVQRLPGDRPWRAITHCNTGALATFAWGTAFGVLRLAHEEGRLEQVYADETRPLLQGSRLTAWELGRLAIPHQVLPDGAAASLILSGAVDFAAVGADRIAANGDTANKIGTLGVALAAHAAGIPFLVVAPQSTIDPDCADGSGIAIEFRDPQEVLSVAGVRVAPEHTGAWNPAFDVTPARYISAIITEAGVYQPVSPEASDGPA